MYTIDNFKMQKRIYNLEKDIYNGNDHTLSINLRISPNHNQISVIDHRATCPKIFHQGAIGSCSANALCCVFYHNLKKFNYENIFIPSRLFLYYNTRAMKHSIDYDNGGSIRDALKAFHEYGICPEELWKYDEKNFKITPPEEAYIFSREYDGIIYARVPQILNQLKQCLIDGYLFVFGMSVFSNLESEKVEKTGRGLQQPSIYDTYLGGHAACAVGFNDNEQVFIVRNSWGSKWGDHGYFYMPYDYMLNSNLVFDIWTFRNRLNDNDFTSHSPFNKKKKCCFKKMVNKFLNIIKK